MDLILQDFQATMPSVRELARMLVRLFAALAVGALIGYQREQMGKAAGFRTHMLVAMGTALPVICVLEYGMGEDAASRVIQGLVTGIGFLGAGAIMKIREEQQIRGLTTAAGIWMTAGASLAIGLGQVGLGVVAGALAWLVLAVFQKVEPAQKAGPPHRNG
jgi:putative Mg2+ transporter-C (MgtC) family protein